MPLHSVRPAERSSTGRPVILPPRCYALRAQAEPGVSLPDDLGPAAV